MLLLIVNKLNSDSEHHWNRWRSSKYLGVVFTSDGRQDEELVTLMGKASAVMRALQY